MNEGFGMRLPLALACLTNTVREPLVDERVDPEPESTFLVKFIDGTIYHLDRYTKYQSQQTGG